MVTSGTGHDRCPSQSRDPNGIPIVLRRRRKKLEAREQFQDVWTEFFSREAQRLIGSSSLLGNFQRTPLVRLDICSLYVLITAMTDRPASWRMPTPKQMEKLAASMGRAPARERPLGPGDDIPEGYCRPSSTMPMSTLLMPDVQARASASARSRSTFCEFRATGASALLKSRRPTRSACTASRPDGRRLRSDCWTTPVRTELADTRRTAAGRPSSLSD